MCRMHHIRQYPLKLIGHANRDNIIIIDVQLIIAIQLVYFRVEFYSKVLENDGYGCKLLFDQRLLC